VSMLRLSGFADSPPPDKFWALMSELLQDEIKRWCSMAMRDDFQRELESLMQWLRVVSELTS